MSSTLRYESHSGAIYIITAAIKKNKRTKTMRLRAYLCVVIVGVIVLSLTHQKICLFFTHLIIKTVSQSVLSVL